MNRRQFALGAVAAAVAAAIPESASFKRKNTLIPPHIVYNEALELLEHKMGRVRLLAEDEEVVH